MFAAAGQTQKKNKNSATTSSNLAGHKAMVKKALEEKKQAVHREEQQRYIDESVNQRVREGLQLILSRIQVFIEDQVKVKVSDEVAIQMQNLKKELESKEPKRSSRQCSVLKVFEEDQQRKKSPNKAIIKSDKPMSPPRKELKTDRPRQSDNLLKVELQNSIEFTEKVKKEVNSQILKYQNFAKVVGAGTAHENGPHYNKKSSNQLFKFNNNACKKRMGSYYNFTENNTPGGLSLNQSEHVSHDVSHDNSMHFNGSFQANMNHTQAIPEEHDPKKCFVMGGKKIKRLSQLRWPRSPNPRSQISPQTNNSERDSNCHAHSPYRRSSYTTVQQQAPKLEKMAAVTERAPHPADAIEYDKQFITVDVELFNQDKSFKSWKKAKNGGGPCSPQTQAMKDQPQDEQPPNGDFTLMSQTRKQPQTNFANSKNSIDLHVPSVEIKRM